MWRYYLISLLLAPGVVVHELGHLIFCLLAGVRIHRVSLFRFSETAGFVVHDEPRSFIQAFFISTGPLTLNSLVAPLLFSQLLPWHTTPAAFLFIWLGLVIALQAIPSNGDARALFKTTNHTLRRNPFAVILYPAVGFIYLLNLLKRLHIDLIYAVFLFWLGAIALKN